jgi:hypothetical protein
MPQDRHFLSYLAQWSCEELDEKIKQRVDFSHKTIEKLIQTCSKMSERNNHICNLLKGTSTITKHI